MALDNGSQLCSVLLPMSSVVSLHLNPNAGAHVLLLLPAVLLLASMKAPLCHTRTMQSRLNSGPCHSMFAIWRQARLGGTLNPLLWAVAHAFATLAIAAAVVDGSHRCRQRRRQLLQLL